MYRTWDEGNGSPIQFVVSLNLHRGHLTASQRACVAAELEPMFAKERRAHQLAPDQLLSTIVSLESIFSLCSS